MRYAFYAAATASALFLSIVAINSPAYVSCADGDRAHCADETFATLAACERFGEVTPYGDDAHCLVK